MKICPLFLVLCLSIFLTACERNFDELMAKAHQAFEEKNHTVVIDSLTLALPRWKEKNGNEKKAEAYELLGKSYHALKKPDQAADAFKVAVKLSDKSYESAYLLGLIYTTSSQHKHAQEAFQNALRMRNEAPLALLGLGDSLFAQGKYEEARTLYRKVIAVSPGVPEALNNLDLTSKKLAVRKQKPLSPSRSRGTIKIMRKKR